MKLRAFTLGARVFAAALSIGAGVLAWRVGGGADAPATPPRPDEASAPLGDGGARPALAAGESYEVATRLTEVAKDARFDMPNAQSAGRILAAHWRKMKPPYAPPLGENGRWVTNIGLRTSANETQWATPTGSQGKQWTPDARIWNMNEGSFDQREALVSSTPGSITFKLTVPTGAVFLFSEGTVNATKENTVFDVTVVDARGTTHKLHHRELPPSAARRWTEGSVDLVPFAGQTIELRLSTEATPSLEAPPPRKKKDSGTASGPAISDAGVVREEVLATPGTAVALWGNPTILAKTKPRVPYNVLWIVVDALRPDVIASFHDDAEDAAKLQAPMPPLEALLPKVPGVTPEIDELTKRAVRFTHAYSAASWTRPGTLAMLSGARSSELGIDTTAWVLQPPEVKRFYASEPPLLPLMLRRQGVATRAFVNNYFMVGYAPVGLDMAFERVDDHRYRTRDTLEITQDATSWIKENKDTRFFAFVNYNSPHEPYEPPPKFVERVAPPPVGPKDKIARLYMAEAAKDDEAIGVLLRTLDETGLRQSTIVVLTADHGETMSSAHAGTSGLDKMPIRYHHAVSNFEETTRVPIVISAPNLPTGKEVKARVRTTDIVPTLLELLGLEQHPRMSGKSMVGLAKGEEEKDERVVVTEGRMSRAIMHEKWRLIVREGAAKTVTRDDKVTEHETELFDLQADPGERRDVAGRHPDVVLEMKARLAAALKNVPVAGARETPKASSAAEADAKPTLHLRFTGGAHPRRVSGTILIGDARTTIKSLDVVPIEIGKDAYKIDGQKLELALTTSPAAPIGLDIIVDPPTVPVTWELWLDDKPWPDEAIFGGPFGLLAPVLKKGVASDEARLAAHARSLPTIDPRRDTGLFVVRERGGEGDQAREVDEGTEEMSRLLKEWGYAHGSGSSK